MKNFVKVLFLLIAFVGVSIAGISFNNIPSIDESVNYLDQNHSYNGSFYRLTAFEDFLGKKCITIAEIDGEKPCIDGNTTFLRNETMNYDVNIVTTKLNSLEEVILKDNPIYLNGKLVGTYRTETRQKRINVYSLAYDINELNNQLFCNLGGTCIAPKIEVIINADLIDTNTLKAHEILTGSYAYDYNQYGNPLKRLFNPKNNYALNKDINYSNFPAGVVKDENGKKYLNMEQRIANCEATNYQVKKVLDCLVSQTTLAGIKTCAQNMINES